ncbi:RmlC-like cupin domain-containing protein [Mycena sp. CBHHK59/15]|nr:RmlC-like cupin domain-containing protein [Mycena sp. CBHHK59/15]
MFSKSALVIALAAAAHVSADAAADKAAEADLVGKLRLAPVATDRITLLSSDDEFAFDFFDPTKAATVGEGGKLVTANSATFPAVIGNGAAMAVGFLGPCSINTPHTHPRATEMQISVNGTIRTGMITENGGRFIMTELPPGSMTVFPMGSIHFQANEGCDPAMFVASFNSEDPGALQIAQRFLGLPPDIIGITLGDIGVEEIAGVEAQIPDNVAAGTDACLKRCHLTRPSQPSLQRQTRVSGNAFPPSMSGASYTYPTAAASTANAYTYSTPANTYTHSTPANTYTYSTPANTYATAMAATYSHASVSIDPASMSSAAAAASAMASQLMGGGFGGFGAGKDGSFLADSSDGDSSSGGSTKPSPAIIALLAINAFLVVGLLVLGTLWLRKRRATARISGHKQLYTAVGVSGDPLFVAPEKVTQYEASSSGHGQGDREPLTHGLSHGPYYDPHEPGSRAPSRPASRQR